MVEFGENVSWTYVMGGLARDYTNTPGGPGSLLAHWLDVAAEGGMPIDPRLWRDAAISSSYPACMAVKAAAELWRLAAEWAVRPVKVVTGELWELS